MFAPAIVASSKTPTRFSELPREWRMAYHGTNSMFLEYFAKNGLRPFEHPVLRELKAATLAIEKHMNAHIETPSKLAAHIGRPPTIFITGWKTQAISYSSHSPEMLDLTRIFGEDVDWFLRNYWGIEIPPIGRKVERYLRAREKARAEFSGVAPVVIEFEIPDISFIRTFKSRDAMSRNKEEQLAKKAYDYYTSNSVLKTLQDEMGHRHSWYRFFDYGQVLSAPIEARNFKIYYPSMEEIRTPWREW